MCTWIVQIVFVAFLVTGAAMTIIALATPAWKEFHNNATIPDSAISAGKDYSKDYSNYQIVVGFFSGACGDGGWEACEGYVKDQIKVSSCILGRSQSDRTTWGRFGTLNPGLARALERSEMEGPDQGVRYARFPVLMSHISICCPRSGMARIPMPYSEDLT